MVSRRLAAAMLLTIRRRASTSIARVVEGTSRIAATSSNARRRLRMRKSRGAAEIEQAQALIALWPGAHKLGGCDSYEGSNQCDDAENKHCPV